MFDLNNFLIKIRTTHMMAQHPYLRVHFYPQLLISLQYKQLYYENN